MNVDLAHARALVRGAHERLDGKAIRRLAQAKPGKDAPADGPQRGNVVHV
jgi:hypothetical protein